MARVSDVNTTDIVDAIRLGCRSMQQMFNADDGDIPHFRVIVRPAAYLDMSLEHLVLSKITLPRALVKCKNLRQLSF